MIFRETELSGAFLVEAERRDDERGFFARIYAEEEFRAQGLATRFVHSNVAFNKEWGTLRGMHYQLDPHAEARLVRCTRGAVHDVIVDLRPGSQTFKEWIAFQLGADNGLMLYVPEGFAHGYLTLEDETETLYLVSVAYAPDSVRGVRWDDRAFGIEWPADPRVISERDKAWPDFTG